MSTRSTFSIVAAAVFSAAAERSRSAALAPAGRPFARFAAAAVTVGAIVGGTGPLSCPTVEIAGSSAFCHATIAVFCAAFAWLAASVRSFERRPFVTQTPIMKTNIPTRNTPTNCTHRRWKNGVGTATGSRRGARATCFDFERPLLLIAIYAVLEGRFRKRPMMIAAS